MHTVQGIRKGKYIRPAQHLGAARLFFAAADPTRIKILLLLEKNREACVTELAEACGASVAVISHHLRILRECRCLQTIRTGKMICYRYVPNAFTALVTGFVKNANRA